MRLLSTKSTIRYLPPKGTAGLARSLVSGYSRVPFPPARTIPSTRSLMRCSPDAGLATRALWHRPRRGPTRRPDRPPSSPAQERGSSADRPKVILGDAGGGDGAVRERGDAAVGCQHRVTAFAASIADAGTAVGEELHELGPAHDRRAGDQVVLVELALLEAGRAHVDGPAGLREILHQIPERREAVLVDVVGVALLAQAHALDAQEHERLLAGSDGRVRDHERDGCLVRVVLRVGEVHAELVGHGLAPFSRASEPLRCGGGARLTRCDG